MYHSENIYDDNFFKIMLKDNAILIKLKNNNNLIISSWLNGGINHNMDYVVNQSLDSSDYEGLLDGNFDQFQKDKFLFFGLNPQKTSGLMTSACMDNYAISTKRYEKLKVTTIVTAGADKNGIKAGDKATFYEYNNHYFNHFGTINIITLIDANLDDGALVTATITATEAKTSILQDLRVESQYSTNISTGTGTDGICVISNKNSNNNIENAGKHSKLGELIAKSVREATKEALYLQTFMSPEFQSTVLSRLSRFNISFDDFCDNSSLNKLEYAEKFYVFNKNKENVSFVSSILNLVDEIQLGLLNIKDIKKTLYSLINGYLGVKVSDEKIECIEDILILLISSINEYLFNQDNR